MKSHLNKYPHYALAFSSTKPFLEQACTLSYSIWSNVIILESIF